VSTKCILFVSVCCVLFAVSSTFSVDLIFFVVLLLVYIIRVLFYLVLVVCFDSVD